MVGAGDVDDAGARAVIEAAARNKSDRMLRSLCMGDKGLTVVSGEVARLTDLQELWLFSNALTALPVGLSRLGVLRVLGLYNNQLDRVHSTLKNKTTRISSATHAHNTNYSQVPRRDRSEGPPC